MYTSFISCSTFQISRNRCNKSEIIDPNYTLNHTRHQRHSICYWNSTTNLAITCMVQSTLWSTHTPCHSTHTMQYVTFTHGRHNTSTHALWLSNFFVFLPFGSTLQSTPYTHAGFLSQLLSGSFGQNLRWVWGYHLLLVVTAREHLHKQEKDLLLW